MNYINTIKKISLIFTGILIALIILEISLQIAEFTSIVIKNYNIKNNKDSNSITILWLGESTTHKQWPPILQNTLNEKVKNKKIKVIDEGKTNIKTDFILSEINNTLFKYNPDIVICMMGINDLGIKFNDSRIKTFNILKILWMYVNYKLSIIENTNINISKELEAAKLIEEQNYNKAEKMLTKLYKKSGYKNPFIYYMLLKIYHITSNYDKLETLLSYDSPIISNSLNIILEYLQTSKKYTYLQIKDWIILNKHKFINSQETFNVLKKYKCSDLMENVSDISENDLIKKEDPKKIRDNTIANYLAIIDIIYQYNPKITVMPMQYPTLPIEYLKQDLKNSKHYDKLIFISNKENFEQALNTHTKEEIFEDMFGGDFGHCTHYGNILVTENIIPKILKLVRDQ